MKKSFLGVLVMAMGPCFGSVANAVMPVSYSGYPVSVRLDNMEDAVIRLQARVTELEARCGGTMPSAPRVHEWACSQSSNFGHAYLGKGATRIEAQTLAKQACAHAENSPFVCSADPSCEQAS